jgi:hypothetical protein
MHVCFTIEIYGKRGRGRALRPNCVIFRSSDPPVFENFNLERKLSFPNLPIYLWRITQARVLEPSTKEREIVLCVEMNARFITETGYELVTELIALSNRSVSALLGCHGAGPTMGRTAI